MGKLVSSALIILGLVGSAQAYTEMPPVCVRALSGRLLPGTPQRIILRNTVGRIEEKIGNTQLQFTIRWDFVYDSFGRPLYMEGPHTEANVAYTQIEMADCTLSDN